MRWWEDDEEWRKIRSGYVSMAEEALFRRLFSSLPKRMNRGRHKTNEVVWSRFRTFDRAATSGVQQVIVKSVGTTKKRSTVADMLRYVARRREEDRRKGVFGSIQLHDQFGREAGFPNSLADDWALKSDKENQKGDRAGLKNIQAWHFVFSLAVEDREDEEELIDALKQAVRQTVSDSFAIEGHKAYWGIHTDCPGRPHAHVIVKAGSEFGGRLHFDRYGNRFHLLRETFKDALARQGVGREATRREDRYDTRRDILQGLEPLRSSKPIHSYKHPPRPTVRRIEEEPTFVSWLAGKFAKTRRQEDTGEQLVEAELPEIFVDRFASPINAYRAWHQLALDGAQQLADGYIQAPLGPYATWLLAKRPETFGQLRQDANQQETPLALRKKLEGIELPDPGPNPDLIVLEDRDTSSIGGRIGRIRGDRKRIIASLVRVLKLRFVMDDDPYLFDQSARRLIGDFDLPILLAPAVISPTKKKRKIVMGEPEVDEVPLLETSSDVSQESDPHRVSKPQLIRGDGKKQVLRTIKGTLPQGGRSRTRGY